MRIDSQIRNILSSNYAMFIFEVGNIDCNIEDTRAGNRLLSNTI